MSSGETTLTLLRRDAVEVPSLVVRAQTPSGERSAKLRMGPVVVGSAPPCDLVLEDERASRQHCSLTIGERGVTVRDLGSKNGTFVRDVAVIEAVVPPGVPITVGASRLEVYVDGAPAVVPLSLAARFGAAIGGSIPMRALFAELERAAPSDVTILLCGETGTGKELLARALHDASPRRVGPFEVLDCAAVSPSLLEAELFGWTRGAFTGAVAARQGVLARSHGGTLFIDELGELPLELQPKLLRALEHRVVRPLGASHWQPFDARIVCGTNRDLRGEVEAGRFRRDLYYRVAMLEARVPPLRSRKEDIPLLVERFLAAQQPPKTLDDLPPGAMGLLLAHEWPGNVRELHNAVTRLVLLPAIEQDLAELGAPSALLPARELLERLPLREARDLVVEQFERYYLASKLRACAGNVSKAAKAVGVSRQFMHRLMDRYGLTREEP
jgi:transcriptional regulator with PAS, ATPase and Fis domain